MSESPAGPPGLGHVGSRAWQQHPLHFLTLPLAQQQGCCCSTFCKGRTVRRCPRTCGRTGSRRHMAWLPIASPVLCVSLLEQMPGDLHPSSKCSRQAQTTGMWQAACYWHLAGINLICPIQGNPAHPDPVPGAAVRQVAGRENAPTAPFHDPGQAPTAPVWNGLSFVRAAVRSGLLYAGRLCPEHLLAEIADDPMPRGWHICCHLHHCM